ncbi:hypothetical protein LV779_10135 [Streptomyces thinghirensis]|nr:hypothetical protein [Streptomyces thinghirensis]
MSRPARSLHSSADSSSGTGRGPGSSTGRCGYRRWCPSGARSGASRPGTSTRSPQSWSAGRSRRPAQRTARRRRRGRRPSRTPLARTLAQLGEITVEDYEAVGLGPDRFARELRTNVPLSPYGLGEGGLLLYERLLHTASLHILNFLTQRSTYIARQQTVQTQQLARLVQAVDVLLERLPSQSAEDAGFEERYADHIADRYGTLTIYGLDAGTREWPLDMAYLSLEATRPQDGRRDAEYSAIAAEQVLAGHDQVFLRGVAGSGQDHARAVAGGHGGEPRLRPRADPPHRAGSVRAADAPDRPAGGRAALPPATSCGRSAVPSPGSSRRGGWSASCAPGAKCCSSTASTRSPATAEPPPGAGCASWCGPSREPVAGHLRPSAVPEDWLAAEGSVSARSPGCPRTTSPPSYGAGTARPARTPPSASRCSGPCGPRPS